MIDKLPPLVKALLKQESYPHNMGEVELIQTQMSFIFLGDEFVYKVKKPVNLGYLDYSTLTKRLHFCHKELELNRRFCPNVYLDVLPITQNKRSFTVDGKGKVVEYAVKMRRLSRHRMMDNLLREGAISTTMIDELAIRISRFHRVAITDDRISTFGSLDTIIRNNEENFTQTEPYLDKTISPRHYEAICSYIRSFIKNNKALFNNRVVGGFIKDLHGDLHTAHICFGEKLCIYDCIEFNDRFRYSDTASEIAFLAMDLDHYGHADLSRRFVDSYIKASGDKELSLLLRFYKCYRAYIRGKVANFKINDPYIGSIERTDAAITARNYFYLAHAYTKSKAALFITVGLVGSGKSTIAQILARKLALTILSSDTTRKYLAGIPATKQLFSHPGKGIYTAEFTSKTYTTLLEEAARIIKTGDSVIIDATFSREDYRQRAKTLASSLNADFFIINCHLDESTTKERLEKRQNTKTTSDGRWEIYQTQLETFEYLKDDRAPNCVIIDSHLTTDDNANLLIDKLI